jgi:hypothetical protein
MAEMNAPWMCVARALEGEAELAYQGRPPGSAGVAAEV